MRGLNATQKFDFFIHDRCGGSAGPFGKAGHDYVEEGDGIRFAGPPGKRFDYLTITPDDHYSLSAHLAAGQM
jgi:hypothetical protein